MDAVVVVFPLTFNDVNSDWGVYVERTGMVDGSEKMILVMQAKAYHLQHS